jgi:molybdenum cofactor cytidylyltransferase
VVTGAYASEVRDNVAGSPVIIAHNGAWASGMAGSIRCGLDALPAGARACLVMLCDQCAVDDQDLGALIAAWVRAPWQVAAAQYAGTLGVPAIFPTEFWPALRALSGDQGARAVIASLPEVTAVALPNAARDVDTPADLGVGTGP